jgi:TonB family protein
MKADRFFLFLIVALLLASTGFSDEKETQPIKEKKTNPRLIYQSLPPYTEEAKMAGIEGTVSLEAIITIEGRARDVKVLRGLGYGLDESAVQTVTEHWRFEPATNNGQPVDAKAHIEILFNDLEKKQPAPEPEPVHIDSLKFKGNKLFSDEQLQAALHEKLATLPVIGKNDIERVVYELYSARGYVHRATGWLPDNVLCIEEGKQFRVGKLEIRGAKVFPSDTLLAVFELKSGDIVDFSKLRDGLEKIKEMYGSLGLVNFNYISEQEIRDNEGVIDITFTINES